jgi:hypothetical protein
MAVEEQKRRAAAGLAGEQPEPAGLHHRLAEAFEHKYTPFRPIRTQET